MSIKDKASAQTTEPQIIKFIKTMVGTTGEKDLWFDSQEILKEGKELLTLLENGYDLSKIEDILQRKEVELQDAVKKYRRDWEAKLELRDASERAKSAKRKLRAFEIDGLLKEAEQMRCELDAGLAEIGITPDVSPQSDANGFLDASLSFEKAFKKIENRNLSILRGLTKKASGTLRLYRRKKLIRLWLRRVYFLFWSAVVFYIALHSALDAIEIKLLKIGGLALLWILHEFWITPLLHKKLHLKQQKDLEQSIIGLHYTKVIITCLKKFLDKQLSRDIAVNPIR
jgi:hypothetical protein